MLRVVIDQIMKDGVERRLKICSSKGADYADVGDVLANFKQVNEVCDILDINPGKRLMDTGLYFIVHKLQRWCNLRGKLPENETVLDTIDDLHNYVDLTYALQMEVPDNGEPTYTEG